RRTLRSGDQCGACAGASSEVANRHFASSRLLLKPIRGFEEALSQKSNIKAKAASIYVELLFHIRQEIEQERRKPNSLQDARDIAISGTVTAASAAVRK